MRSRKPILFVDFDGVITRNPEEGEPLATRDRFLPVALARPRVIVSSTWRIMPPPEAGCPPYDAVAALNAWLRDAGSETLVEGVHEDCSSCEDIERVRGAVLVVWWEGPGSEGRCV